MPHQPDFADWILVQQIFLTQANDLQGRDYFRYR